MAWKRITRAVAVVGVVVVAAACGGDDDDAGGAGGSAGGGGGGEARGACVLSAQAVEEVVGDISVQNVEQEDADPASTRPQDECEYFTMVTNEEASLGMTGVVRINVRIHDDSERGDALVATLAAAGEELDVGEDGAVADGSAGAKLGERYVFVGIHPNTITEEDERAADLLRSFAEELD